MAWSQALRNGIAAAHARDFAQARVLLHQALSETPASAPAWYWAALAAETPTDAICCLRRVVDLDPSQAVARDALGKLLVVSAVGAAHSDPEEARVVLNEASQVAPGLDAVWIALSTLAPSMADRLDALRRAVRLSPHLKDLRARLHEMLVREAVATARAGSKAQACALFREAADNDPRDARVWQALARLADSRTDAIHALRQLVRLAPAHPAHRADLKAAIVADARALQIAGKKREAERRWREAVALDGCDVDSLLGLAATAADAAEVRRAVDNAHRLNPTHEKVVAWMAKINPAVAPAAAARPPAANATRTVMVVDDSPTIRKIVALTLERAGYTVVAEPDGECAVSRLAQIVPDLILLDITMPKLDGYEVCKRIKEDPRTAHVPVVMLSGKDGFFDKVKGRMVGATEYLTKPFQAPAVLKVIASHCRPGPEVAHG